MMEVFFWERLYLTSRKKTCTIETNDVFGFASPFAVIWASIQEMTGVA